MYHARRALPALALFGVAAGAALPAVSSATSRAEPGVVLAAEPPAMPAAVSPATSQAAIDAEVVANLTLGGIFAGAAHLEERLEGLGGRAARFEVSELAGGIGVTVLPTDPGEESAIRLYARVGPVPSLVWSHQARGTLRAEPVPSRGEPRLLVLVWEDRDSPLAARDVTAMVLALVPRPAVLWRSADGGVVGAVQDVSRRGDELRVSRSVAYPGVGAGCDRATRRVEIYRLDPGSRLDPGGRLEASGGLRGRRADGRVVLERVDAVEPWHRELREAVLRVFARSAREVAELTAKGDTRPVGGIALPRGLESAPICDYAEGAAPRRARVGATDGAGRAWWLEFARSPSGWQLAGVRPVLD